MPNDYLLLKSFESGGFLANLSKEVARRNDRQLGAGSVHLGKEVDHRIGKLTAVLQDEIKAGERTQIFLGSGNSLSTTIVDGVRTDFVLGIVSRKIHFPTREVGEKLDDNEKKSHGEIQRQMLCDEMTFQCSNLPSLLDSFR